VPHLLKQEINALARLSGPITMTFLLQIAAGVLDTIMSGHYSAKDLAGVSIGSNILLPMLLASVGLAMGLVPIVAQANGAKHYKQVFRAVYQAFWIAVISSAVICVVLINIESFLFLFDINKQIRRVTSGYLQAICFGIPALLVYSVLRSYTEGLSLTRPALLAGIISLIANAALNYILIYGKLGFPALGGVGCGWATAVAYWISCIFMVCYIIFSRSFSAGYLFGHFFSPNWIQIQEQIKLGLPISIKFLIQAGAFTLITLSLSRYGATVVAAHHITANIAVLASAFWAGITQALTIRVGHFLGLNRPSAARLSACIGVCLGAIYGVVGAIGLFYLATPVAALYTSDIAIRSLTVELLSIGALYLMVASIHDVSAGALRGYKDTKVPLLLVIFSLWVISLPLGYSLGMTNVIVQAWGAKGFWAGLLVGMSIAALLMINRLRRVSNRVVHSMPYNIF